MRLTGIYIKETYVVGACLRVACWQVGWRSVSVVARCGFIVASVWLIAWAQWGRIGHIN